MGRGVCLLSLPKQGMVVKATKIQLFICPEVVVPEGFSIFLKGGKLWSLLLWRSLPQGELWKGEKVH